jgi:hypothetical protein
MNTEVWPPEEPFSLPQVIKHKRSATTPRQLQDLTERF